MKKIKYAYLIIILCGISFLFLFYYIINDRNLSPVESFIKDKILYIEKILYTPIKFTVEKIDDYKNFESESKTIKKQIDKIKKYDNLKNELEEKKKIIKELETSLELKNDLTDYDVISSSVINRVNNSFYQTLTIDKGKKDGIEKDMAVLSNKGLIGKVLNTTKNTSTIKLLTTVNENYQISVLIEVNEKSIYGLLSGFEDGKLIVNNISDNTDISEFSKVVTTGLDNIFPSGILIGYVDKVKKDNFDLSKTVYVNPVSNFDDIKYVSVLKRKNVE